MPDLSEWQRHDSSLDGHLVGWTRNASHIEGQEIRLLVERSSKLAGAWQWTVAGPEIRFAELVLAGRGEHLTDEAAKRAADAFAVTMHEESADV